MTGSLALIPTAVESHLNRNDAFRELREMVLNSVASEHSKRNYAKALDEVFALCEDRKQPLSRALLMEYRAAMLEKKLSASTVNVRLSAVRKLIGEAQRNGIIGAEEAANLAGVPNLSQKGTRLGNWLTREQAKDLLTVPDRSKIKASGTMRFWRCCWAALCGGRSWPVWTLTASRCARAAGFCLTFVGRVAESAPWRFRSGSSMESMPG